MTVEERKDALVRNGITAKDLEDNYVKGFDEGFKIASGPVIKTCYAAICLALKELHGFGKKRCYDVLQAVDDKILNSLTSMEIIDEVWKEIGLQIDFNDPLEPIKETEDSAV